MATRDSGGQQRSTRTREETEEVEASVDAEVAERHKEVSEDIDSILNSGEKRTAELNASIRKALPSDEQWE